MRAVKITSMYLATIIVLLHSFVPHHHHSELITEDHIEEHEEASSLVDFLALAFHFEQHDGQLEKYDSGTEFQLDDIEAIQYFIPSHFEFTAPTQAKVILVTGNQSVPLSNIISCTELRGPPSVA